MKWTPKKVIGTVFGVLLIVAGLSTSNPVLLSSGMGQVQSAIQEGE